jgi:hypothetical protein
MFISLNGGLIGKSTTSGIYQRSWKIQSFSTRSAPTYTWYSSKSTKRNGLPSKNSVLRNSTERSTRDARCESRHSSRTTPTPYANLTPIFITPNFNQASTRNVLSLRIKGFEAQSIV